MVTTCSSQDTSRLFLSLYKSFSYPQSRAEPPQENTQLIWIKKESGEIKCLVFFLKLFERCLKQWDIPPVSDTINKSLTQLSLSECALRRSLNNSIKTAPLQTDLKTDNWIYPLVHATSFLSSLGHIPRSLAFYRKHTKSQGWFFFSRGGCTRTIRIRRFGVELERYFLSPKHFGWSDMMGKGSLCQHQTDWFHLAHGAKEGREVGDKRFGVRVTGWGFGL